MENNDYEEVAEMKANLEAAINKIECFAPDGFSDRRRKIIKGIIARFALYVAENRYVVADVREITITAKEGS